MHPHRWLKLTLTLAGLALCSILNTGCPPQGQGTNDNSSANGNGNEPGQGIPDEIDVEVTGDGTVDQESIGDNLLRLTAVPGEGWEFESWGGAVTSFENPLTVRPAVGMNITVVFVELPPPDADGDGVPDVSDLCPDSTTGTDVDANGCAANQRDTDGDGVKDDLDNCADTPAGETVNADGCTTNQLDTDSDGISDEVDDCALTPAGSSVNEHGCATSQLDTDQDGVKDDHDNCPNTPTTDDVDEHGCTVTAGAGCDGATGDCFSGHATGGCGDADCCAIVCGFDDYCCDTEWDEGCAEIALQDCPGAPGGGGGGGGPGGGSGFCGDFVITPGEDCDPPDGTLCGTNCRYICGNEVLQGNEQCEPPNTTTCDSQCRLVTNDIPTAEGDWLSTQFILNGASGFLAFNEPETYRLNASGSLTTLFVTVDEALIKSDPMIGGQVTVINSMVSPGTLTDVFRIDYSPTDYTIFRAKIDVFSIVIGSNGNATWNFDYTTQEFDHFEGAELTANTRLQGTQTGTVGGDPAQIVWTANSGTFAFDLQTNSCDICTLFALPCEQGSCSLSDSGSFDDLLSPPQPGIWTSANE